MIRSLRALAWMRFRLFVNSMKRTGRRDTLEQISRALAGVMPVILTIALVPSALALAWGGFLGGRILATGDDPSSWWLAGIRLGLGAATLMVGLLPLMRGAGGRESGLTRLLLLPIPHRVLLFSEISAGFGDPWLALVVPFLLGIPLGLAAAGAPAAALLALAAALALLLTLGAINACSSLGMSLLFRDRRRGEWLTILGAGLAMFIAVATTGIGNGRDGNGGQDRAAETQTIAAPAETPEAHVDRLIPRPARILPGELYVGAVKTGLAGNGTRATMILLGLFAWCGGMIILAGALYRRLLETPAGSSRRASARKAAKRMARYPFMTSAASAVALATVNSTLRTVRGKIAVYLNVAIIGMLLVLFRSRSELELPDGSPLDFGQIVAVAGILLSSLSMHPVVLNLFANDQAGLTRQFLAPLTYRDMVIGKMMAGTALIAFSSALCTALAAAMFPGGPAAGWLALGFIFVSSHLILGPLSVLLSAIFPKHSDLSRLGKRGNPHGLAGLIGFLLVLVIMAPPTFLAALALFALERPLLAVVLPAAWTALAALVSVPLFRVAVAAVGRRSDNLMLVAAGR